MKINEITEAVEIKDKSVVAHLDKAYQYNAVTGKWSQYSEKISDKWKPLPTQIELAAKESQHLTNVIWPMTLRSAWKTGGISGVVGNVIGKAIASRKAKVVNPAAVAEPQSPAPAPAPAPAPSATP